MTYPPQPPGPGGWGQPQQGPYGQPGGQFPPSGPQPGGPYPPSGPQPGGPFPPSGPHQPYGNQPPPGYGPPQPGYGPPPSPYPGPGLPGPQPAWGGQPPKKSPLPWILGGGGGLVVIIVVVVILFMTLGGGGSPQATAQQAVDILNSGNYSAMTGIVCAQDKADVQKETQNFNPTQQLSQEPDVPDSIKQILQNVKLRFSLKSLNQDSGSHASATFTEQLTNLPADLPPELQQLGQPQDLPPLDVIKESGDWKICGFSKVGNSPGN